MRLLRPLPALEERNELVAEVDEGGPRHVPAHGDRLEDRRVERNRCIQVGDLERDVVDPDETRLHGAS